MKITPPEALQSRATAGDLAVRHRRPGRGSQRVKRRTAAAPPPARRNAPARRPQADEARRLATWRAVRAALAFAAALALVGVASYAYHRFTTSTFFALKNIDLRGDVHIPRQELLSALRAGASNGLWKVDLDDLRAALKRHPWVLEAEVERVLPDTLRVRISEREPFARARLADHSLVWVDREGIMLGDRIGDQTVKASRTLPLVSGLDEAESASAAEFNRRLMLQYQEVIEDLERGDPPLISEVAEVGYDEIEGARLHLDGRREQIIVGKQDYHARLNQAIVLLEAVARDDLSTLELFRITDAKRLLGPVRIAYLNMTPSNRVIVGLAQ
jgi:cell division septal protein FtsQ